MDSAQSRRKFNHVYRNSHFRLQICWCKHVQNCKWPPNTLWLNWHHQNWAIYLPSVLVSTSSPWPDTHMCAKHTQDWRLNRYIYVFAIRCRFGAIDPGREKWCLEEHHRQRWMAQCIGDRWGFVLVLCWRMHRQTSLCRLRRLNPVATEMNNKLKFVI